MVEHWCTEHETVWFKKGAMRGYAHPILGGDGEPTGQWCNEPKEKPPVAGKLPIAKPEQDVTMSKAEWGEKDRITRKSIERQTSLNAAVEVGKILGTDKVTTDKIIATAKLFEAYLEGKEEAKSRLVEEAKKLGAKEIEKKD